MISNNWKMTWAKWLLLGTLILVGVGGLVGCGGAPAAVPPAETAVQPAMVSTEPVVPTAVPTVTPSPEPTTTFTPEPTATPTEPPTPTPTRPALFEPPAPLSAENVSQLTQLVRLGLGDYQTQAWSPDSRFVALATGAGVLVLRAEDGALVFSDFPLVSGGGGTLDRALSFSRDGNWLAMTNGTQVLVYSLGEGTFVPPLAIPLPFFAKAVAFVGESMELLVTGEQADLWGNSLNRYIGRYDARSGQVLKETPVEFTQQFYSENFTLAQDGSLLFAYNYPPKRYEMYDASGRRTGILEMEQFGAYAKTVNAGLVAVSRRDKSYNAGPIEVYQADGKLVTTLPAPGSISYLFIAPDGQSLSFVDGSMQLRQYSLPGGELLQKVPVRGMGMPSPDLSRTCDNSQVYETATGQALGSPLETRADIGKALAFNQDGSLLLVAYNGWNDELRRTSVWADVFETRTMDKLRTFELAANPASGAKIDLFSLLADGTTLAFHLTKSPGVEFWDISQGQRVDTFVLGIPAEVVGVSGDGQRVLAADDEGNAELWDRPGKVLLATRSGIYQYVGSYSAGFTPDARLAVLSGSDTMIIWSLPDGEKPTYVEAKSNGRMALSPDGMLLAVEFGNSSAITVYDLSTLQQTRQASGMSWSYAGFVDNLAFVPDGSVLVVQGFGIVDFLEPLTGNLLYSLPYAAVQTALSGDGRLLATSSYDGTLRLWGVKAP